jgi:hypothetical protein
MIKRANPKKSKIWAIFPGLLEPQPEKFECKRISPSTLKTGRLFIPASPGGVCFFISFQNLPIPNDANR